LRPGNVLEVCVYLLMLVRRLGSDEQKLTFKPKQFCHHENLHGRLPDRKWASFPIEAAFFKNALFFTVGRISCFSTFELQLDTDCMRIVSVYNEIGLDPERPFELARRLYVIPSFRYSVKAARRQLAGD
jgi:hypothetical protein